MPVTTYNPQAMNKHNLKSVFALALAFFLNHSVYASGASVSNAWIAEAPPVSKVMAAYMTISNDSAETVTVLSAESADFGKIEFHQTVNEDGIARMKHQPSLVIPANASLSLEPGGYHMMLFRPARTLRAGDSSSMLLKTSSGKSLTVDIMVKKAAMEASHEHHHHHH